MRLPRTRPSMRYLHMYEGSPGHAYKSHAYWIGFGFSLFRDKACAGSRALLTYIAKYVAKPEIQTASYRDIINQILRYVSSHWPLLSAVLFSGTKALFY